MKEKSSINLIIAVVILVILGGAGYFYANRDRSSTDEALSSTLSSDASSTVDDELLTALRSLQKLKLDPSIFSSPIWLSFTDFGKTIAPQASGRQNPFAPIDSSAVTAVAATTTAPVATPR